MYFPVAETAVPDRESKRDDTEGAGRLGEDTCGG